MTRYEMKGKDGRTVEFVEGDADWYVNNPNGYLVKGCCVRYGDIPGWAWKVSETSERKMRAAYHAWYDDDTLMMTSLLPWEK